MPDSFNTAAQNAGQTNASPAVFAVPPSDDGLTPLQMDQIYAGLSDADWERFRGFEQVAIGRRSASEPYAILLGFNDGEQLADFWESLPETANFFVAWHRDLKLAAAASSK